MFLDEEEDDDESSHENLYALLNLSENCTTEEIQAAFRRLSRIFHPDKHTDPDKKKDAQVIFQKIRYAHDILSDKTQRTLYDTYGMKGIKNQNTAIIIRGKSSEEILAEYELIKERLEEERLMEITQPSTQFTLGFDMTDLFDRYLQEHPDDRVYGPQLALTRTMIAQSVKVGMTKNDSISLRGEAEIKNGQGVGQTCVHWRRQLAPFLNDTWMDNQLSFNSDEGLALDVQLSRRLTTNIVATIGSHVTYRPSMESLLFDIRSSIEYQLSKRLTGNFFVDQRHVKTTLTWSGDNYSLFATTSLGSRTGVSAGGTYRITEKETSLEVCGHLNTHSIRMDCGIKQRVSKYTSLSAFISVGEPLGVMLKLKMQRGTQHYIMPIWLSEMVDPVAVTYGTVVPLVVYLVIRKLVYDPWCREEREEVKTRQREQQTEQTLQRKQEALSAQSLMKETANRCRETETQQGGLIIVTASYGRLMSGRVSGDENNYTAPTEIVDVTVPIQIMVERSSIELPPCFAGKDRSSLEGFYDPCPGEEKALYIRYLFKNKNHEVTVQDKEKLAIPMEKHILPDQS